LTDVLDARLAYELIVGRCSDNHWRDVRKILAKNQMELSVENVQFFAEIRQIIPRSAIGVEGVLKCYSEAEKLLNKTSRRLKGLEVLTTLNQYGIKPHQSTVIEVKNCTLQICWMMTLATHQRIRVTCKRIYG